MNKDTYEMLEAYMRSCMKDSAHDREHIYRVLYVALDIAKTESQVDYDVLICACLLHDIGRQEQIENQELSHAQVGAEKAGRFLREHSFAAEFADRVSECIRAHSYRANHAPRSIESKILFDADKIDVAGAMGIARTLMYQGRVCEPLYQVNPDGLVSDGQNDKNPSFFQEYKYKLENIYDKFFTVRGTEIASQRRQAAVDFYNSILAEVHGSYQCGRNHLAEIME